MKLILLVLIGCAFAQNSEDDLVDTEEPDFGPALGGESWDEPVHCYGRIELTSSNGQTIVRRKLGHDGPRKDFLPRNNGAIMKNSPRSRNKIHFSSVRVYGNC